MMPILPAAANQFEAIHGLTTVYDNFSGNLEVGFTATFRVLGKDNYILMVERKNSNYRVLLGELNPEDKSKCRFQGLKDIAATRQVHPQNVTFYSFPGHSSII